MVLPARFPSAPGHADHLRTAQRRILGAGLLAAHARFRSRRRPGETEVLLPVHAAVSLRCAAHGPCAQLHHRRRGQPLPAHARQERAAADGLRCLRPAGGERGDRAQCAAGAMDLRQHRVHEDPAQTAGLCHRRARLFGGGADAALAGAGEDSPAHQQPGKSGAVAGRRHRRQRPACRAGFGIVRHFQHRLMAIGIEHFAHRLDPADLLAGDGGRVVVVQRSWPWVAGRRPALVELDVAQDGEQPGAQVAVRPAPQGQPRQRPHQAVLDQVVGGVGIVQQHARVAPQGRDLGLDVQQQILHRHRLPVPLAASLFRDGELGVHPAGEMAGLVAEQDIVPGLERERQRAALARLEITQLDDLAELVLIDS